MFFFFVCFILFSFPQGVFPVAAKDTRQRWEGAAWKPRAKNLAHRSLPWPLCLRSLESGSTLQLLMPYFKVSWDAPQSASQHAPLTLPTSIKWGGQTGYTPTWEKVRPRRLKGVVKPPDSLVSSLSTEHTGQGWAEPRVAPDTHVPE